LKRVRIGVTVGDPAGIGPEIARKALAHPELAACEIRLYGPSEDDELRAFERGRVSAAAGRAAYDAIVRAVGTHRPAGSMRSRRRR
jgi:4-hydroxy-L-threonine phosphate dehydrogenase PdxA